MHAKKTEASKKWLLCRIARNESALYNMQIESICIDFVSSKMPQFHYKALLIFLKHQRIYTFNACITNRANSNKN